MRNFATLVADMDNFNGSADDLPSEYNAGNPQVHCYDFSVSPGTEANQIVLMGRGLLFENDWSMAGTVSTIVEDLTQQEGRDAYEEITSHMDSVTQGMNPTDGFSSKSPVSGERELGNDPAEW